jgi:hypothetical protein
MKTRRESFRQLDFRDVKFPSDVLTVGAVRKRHWMLFDDGFGEGDEAQPRFFLDGERGGHSGDVLGHLLFSERAVATCTYADAAGVRRPHCDFDGHRQELQKLYQRYGLAAGRAEARLLVREVEEEGQKLARSPTWSRRPPPTG